MMDGVRGKEESPAKVCVLIISFIKHSENEKRMLRRYNWCSKRDLLFIILVFSCVNVYTLCISNAYLLTLKRVKHE